MQYAHRVSYAMYVGRIPDEHLVCHRCDNGRCVRPSHLFIGTHADNAADKVSKNRQARPFGNRGWRNLTPATIDAIRELVGAGESQAAVALRLGVHPQTVADVARGKGRGDRS